MDTYTVIYRIGALSSKYYWANIPGAYCSKMMAKQRTERLVAEGATAAFVVPTIKFSNHGLPTAFDFDADVYIDDTATNCPMCGQPVTKESR